MPDVKIGSSIDLNQTSTELKRGRLSGVADTEVATAVNPFPVGGIVTADQTTITGDGTTDRPLRAIGGGGGVGVEDEGVSLGTFSSLNFVGSGVVATDAGGGVAQISVAGGGGSFPDITDNPGVLVTIGPAPLLVNMTAPGVALEVDTPTAGTAFFISDAGGVARAEMNPGMRFDTGLGFGNANVQNLAAGNNTGVSVPNTVNIFATGAGSAFLQGINVPAGANGFQTTGAKFVWIVNKGPNDLQINDQDPTEPIASNRFLLPGGAAITLRAGGAALVANLPMTPGTRWVCLGFNA